MNQQILRSKFLLFIAFFVIVLMLVITTNSASAASGKGYFSEKAACTTNFEGNKCSNTPSISKNDVLPGRPDNNAIPADKRKKDNFIKFIKANLTSKDERTSTGAAFIVNTMLKEGPNSRAKKPSVEMISQWEERLNNPDITLSSVNADPNDYGNGKVSFYDPIINDDFFAEYSASKRPLLLFTDNTAGKVVYVLEIPCGNPIGGLDGLPQKPKQTATITPITNGSITVFKGEQVSFNFRVDTSNVNDTGNDTFNAQTVDSVGSTGIGTRNYNNNRIAGNNPRMGPVTETFTPANTGQYCRRLSITNKPAYAVAFDSVQQCINVVESNVSTTTSPYEKGEATNTIIDSVTHQISLSRCFPGTSIDINWNVSGQTSASATYNSNITNTLNNANNCTATYKPNISGNWLDSFNAGQQAGDYKTLAYNKESLGKITVYEVPYTRFYGQDIYACKPNTNPSDINGKIFFNSKTNPPGSQGGATQYAAIAKNTINTASAAFRTNNPTPPSGLSVSSYTGTISCSKDIYNKVVSELKTSTITSNNDVTISDTLIQKGGTTIVTSDGKNIYINGNITGGDINKIATIISGKNIYIAPSVMQIDAILIAKNTIYTCAEDNSSEVTRNNWATQCNHKLTINGAVSAGNIRFARSIGTRLMASDLAPDGNTISGSNGGISTAAEIINFPAYLNFAPLQLDDNSDDSYQAIFNVPPYL